MQGGVGWVGKCCSALGMKNFGDQAEEVGTAPFVAPLEQDLAQGSNSRIKLGHSGLMPDEHSSCGAG